MKNGLGTGSGLEDLGRRIVGCRKCPRLVDFRESVLSGSTRHNGEEFWRKPITGYGDSDAHIMVVGLAPAASGANRTGRVFTGDRSSDILVSVLHKLGLANIPTSTSRDDGLLYSDLFLTLAVRCVPPDNRPTTEEISNCLGYLDTEVELLSNVKSIVALGVVAFNSLIRIFRGRGFNTRGMKFSNGAFVQLGDIRVYSCYHPSPRNINTGRATPEGILEVMKDAYGYARS